MKYIDADKLKAEIKELNLVTKTYDEQVVFNNALSMVVEIIDSLQQEHPDVDCHELKEAADDNIRKVVDAAGHPGWDWTTQDVAEAFIAGAKWQYQKDRYEFAKLKTKEWMSGYDDAVSRFVKIPYQPEDWYLDNDKEYICGARFDDSIPAGVELYYKKRTSNDNDRKNPSRD